MNTLSSLFLLLLAAAAFAGVTLAIVRLIQQDRPATPPGRSDDWREDALAWSRLGIS
jgi:hypothetical protein